MATTKITNPELFDLGSLNTALKLPSGTTAQRPTSPSTGEWRYNTTTNLVEFWDGGAWRDLQSENIPPINSEHFIAVTWTGDGTVRDIPTGFKPDFVWIKSRSVARNHYLYDSTRGVNNQILSNTNQAQETNADRMTAFNATSFTVGTSSETNNNGETYVAWCWKANGGTTSSNTDGTIASTVQVNSKAGFSIVRNTGNGVQGATIGHGLGVAPELIILKDLTAANHWLVGNSSSGWTKAMHLDLDNADNASNLYWADTAPTSTVYSVGFTSGAYNVSGNDYIAYCFTPVVGYSKFGTYTGNGSTNGPIVNTGFEPAFVIIKRTSGSGDWRVYDNKRGSSSARYPLYANLTNVEGGGLNEITFLSNGFQLGSATNVNDNGQTYIYIAFGSDASAAPALANSFNISLWTGNGSSQSISGLGFSPNWVWGKERSNTSSNELLDTIRGATNYISTNLTNAQGTSGQGLQSFNADGFTVGNDGAWNQNGETYVGWSWKANPLLTINTDGTIQSIVSANQAAGFSIVKYTGNGTNNATVGHGLSATPDLVINKGLSSTSNWRVASSGLTNTNGYLKLNGTDAESTNLGNDGSITKGSLGATTITLTAGASTSNNINTSGSEYIMYCFYSVSGFSKIGTYTGNGSATGPIVTTGFQPDFVMIKSSSLAGTAWMIIDSARSPSNPRQLLLQPQSAAVEQNVGNAIDFNADNFQLTDTNDSRNKAGETYIYMAFKDNYEYASTGTMAFMLIAGGGGGGVSTGANTGITYVGCGGGAGGFRGSGKVTGGGCSPQTDISLAAGTYTVTIGAGGSPGVSGSTSSIAGPSLTTITTTGGGRGASSAYQPEGGGSAGGRSTHNSLNQSAVACEGFPALEGSQVSWQAGGGGAGGAQTTTGSSNASGIGVESAMTGTATYYAGGGAPGGFNTTSRPQPQAGGGGQGQLMGETAVDTPSIITGTINTGAGGGGGSNNTNTGAKGGGGSGGSGFTVLRLKTAEYSGTTTGSPTVTTDGDETIIQFTGSGTYVHS